jgi:hypothetical protein
MNDVKKEVLRYILAVLIVLGPLLLGLISYFVSGYAGWAQVILCGGFVWLGIICVWAVSTLGDE